MWQVFGKEFEVPPIDAASDPRWSSPTALYRYFTPDGCLLYVGISNQPDDRHVTHYKRSAWFKYAAYRSVEWFPTRALADWAEMHVIAVELPDFNRAAMPPGRFERVADMWYLTVCEGDPVGQYFAWSERPATFGVWRVAFEPSGGPDWAENTTRVSRRKRMK